MIRNNTVCMLGKNVMKSSSRLWQEWLKVGFAYVTFGSSNFFVLLITGKHGSMLKFLPEMDRYNM